jgi:opacity protein-like surface antigen
MNRILMVVTMFVIPLIFTLKVNSQVVSSEPTKAEINQLFKTVPLEKIDKYGVPVKEPKFSASVGMGSGYGFGEEKLGKLKKYSNVNTPSLRIEYSLSKYVKLQGEYSRTSKFKAANDDGYSYLTTSFAFYAITLNVKAGVPVKINGVGFYPYIVIGVGKANVDYARSYKSATLTFQDGEKTSNQCSKGGIGVEINLHKNIYLFSELNNWRVNWESIESQYSYKQSYKLYYQQIITGLTIKF